MTEQTRTTLASWAMKTMRAGFCLLILLFPLGRFFQEVGTVVSVTALAAYLALSYQDSNLKRFRLKWIYLAFVAWLVIKTFHTIDFESSLYALKMNIWKGFALIFVGIEFVRSRKDLAILVVLFTVMGFYEGLDGIYQYVTGFDLINNTSMQAWGGRLTGSLKTYRVGNLMSLVMPVTLALPALLPRAWPWWQRWGLTLVLAVPGLFLLVGSQTRSAYAGLFMAVLALFFLHRGLSKRVLLSIALLVAVLLFFGPERISVERIARDGRIQELWPMGLEIFRHAPILGTGIDSYPKAAAMLELEPSFHGHYLPHPHNIYIQLAAETGLIGLGLFLAFLGSHLVWAVRIVRQRIRARTNLRDWHMAACLWSASFGYTVTAFSAHNYFRSWWLAMAMSVIGITIGTCLALGATDDDSSSGVE